MFTDLYYPLNVVSAYFTESIFQITEFSLCSDQISGQQNIKVLMLIFCIDSTIQDSTILNVVSKVRDKNFL